MPPAVGAVALHSSIYSISSKKPTSNLHVSPNPTSLLQNHPLYTPTHAKLSLEFKEKILCLEVMGVDTSKALSQNPTLCITSCEKLKPALVYLKRLRLKDLKALAYQHSVLLESNAERILIPKLKFLQNLGFSKDEGNGEKVEEAERVSLVLFFSLENRIKPKHIEVVQSGISLPLSAMLKSADEEFRKLIRQIGG
ncbi:hypothetical protein RJT34_08473 [Clitoria ternatea]|uniref:Uncharacterized protein n=1 Tax=Clitoria ternatea TaxID=43366 RepID=A0AAN9PU41_CLITE